jgi:hypothetical protein
MSLLDKLFNWFSTQDIRQEYFDKHGEYPEDAEARRKAEEKMRSRRAQSWHREGPQLVGSACAECKAKIVFQNDATVCGICQQPLHHACTVRHVHNTAPNGPFR